MLNSDGSRLLTASDLLSFLGCHHSIFLDHMGARDPESPDKEDAQAQLINDKGNELESAHLDRLRNEGRKIVEVPPRLPLADRHALTLDAMRAGAEIVHGGVLCANGWLTRPDLLRRAESVSALGAHTDEPVHITLARTELARHVLQLAASSELLVHVQGCLPRAMGVVLADGRELELDPHHFTHYVRRAQRRLEGFAQQPPDGSYPQPCAHCDGCRWHMHCAERWEADDHLSLVANIRGSQIRALEAAGIRTVRALATAPSNTRPSRLAAETFATLRAQARLQIEKRNTGEDRIEILPPSAGRGFARLPESDPGDLFFDMEGDPFQPDGLEYLFGVHYREDGERRFRAFWAHDQAQEKAAFEDFMDFVEARRRAHPNTHI